ncbi:MAG: acetyl-CoA C-acyltransferase [Planctomycetota bacterium]
MTRPKAVIVDAVRTPIGRSHPDRGVFRETRADDMAAACVSAVLQRQSLDPARVDDLILGCANQSLEQGANVARLVALLAGLPPSVPGATVNRLCGSGLEAVRQAVLAIETGNATAVVAGGLEHMHHLPIGHGIDLHPQLGRYVSQAALRMGLAAEYLAQSRGISRERQDRFALESHRRAAAAHAAGHFSAELIPVPGRDERGRWTLVNRDIPVRQDTSLAALAALPPAFLPELGSVTAGNSSPLSDGATACLIMDEKAAIETGRKPLAVVRATAVVGIEPSLMGLGPVPAARLALDRAGLRLADIDLIEINEAFAAQTLACLDALELDGRRVNTRGGAIALGHPLGASGARIVATLTHAMRDTDARFGMAALCIGFGQGMAMVLERYR